MFEEKEKQRQRDAETALKVALSYAALGIPVAPVRGFFPPGRGRFLSVYPDCHRNTRDDPYADLWEDYEPQLATTDRFEIGGQYWGKNIAAFTGGGGIIALAFKRWKDMAAAAEEFDLPEIKTSDISSQFPQILIFRAPKRFLVESSQDELGKGVTVLGEEAFVMMPPSVDFRHDRYRVQYDDPLQEVPDKLRARLRPSKATLKPVPESPAPDKKGR